MDWYAVDKDYITYLKGFDNKVGDVDYGDLLKPYIGVVIEVNACKYYIPVSSPKDKHNRMSNQVDFMKIFDTDGTRLLAVMNINNMIPVPDNCLTKIKYDEISNFRSFENANEETDYVQLLQKEKAFIDSKSAQIVKNATDLLRMYGLNPNSNLSRRCCNFPLLEEKSKEYSQE